MKEEKLQSYHEYLENLQKKFNKVTFFFLSRDENYFSDALDTLASMIDIPLRVTIRPLIIERREKMSYCYAITSVEEEQELPWYLNIYNFINDQKYHKGATKKDKRAIMPRPGIAKLGKIKIFHFGLVDM